MQQHGRRYRHLIPMVISRGHKFVRVNSGKVHNDTSGAAAKSVVMNADILPVVTGERSVTVGNAVVPCKSLLTICYLLRAC